MTPRIPDLEIERSFAAFVTSQKRARFLLLLESRKGRDKIRQSLAHSPDWDPTILAADQSVQRRKFTRFCAKWARQENATLCRKTIETTLCEWIFWRHSN